MISIAVAGENAVDHTQLTQVIPRFRRIDHATSVGYSTSTRVRVGAIHVELWMEKGLFIVLCKSA